MKLSPDEQKVLRFLRRQQAGWPVVRWVTLVCSLLVLLFGMAVALLGNAWAVLVAPLWIGGAAGCLSYAISCWRGRPAVSLLLRLVEESVRREETERRSTAAADERLAAAGPRINTSVSRIRYDMTMDDLIAFHRHHFRNSPTARRERIRGTAIMVALLLGLSAITSYQTGEPVWLVAGFVLSVLFAIAYPRFHQKYVEQSAVKMYSEGTNQGLFGAQELEIVDDGLVNRSGAGESKRGWNSIDRIETTDDHGFIYVSSVSAHVIPRGAVIEGSFEVFMDAVNQQVQSRRQSA